MLCDYLKLKVVQLTNWGSWVWSEQNSKTGDEKSSSSVLLCRWRQEIFRIHSFSGVFGYVTNCRLHPYPSTLKQTFPILAQNKRKGHSCTHFKKKSEYRTTPANWERNTKEMGEGESISLNKKCHMSLLCDGIILHWRVFSVEST